MSKQVPVTILTGYLGAGKTTFLNRLLKEQHGHKIAVIENEFGEEGIDNDILEQQEGEQIIEMNNGCICCNVRGDLVRILGELKDQRQAGTLNFERVIIETTGLAAPSPVAQTFFMEDSVADYYRLDAILTVVDAKHANFQLDNHPEAQEQVGFADRILLSKTDLVSEAEQAELRGRLSRINARAPIQAVNFGTTAIDDVLDINGFNVNAILEVEPTFFAENHHHHDDEVGSFVFKSSRPFNPQKLDEFMDTLVQVYGESMLRYKGLLYIKGTPRRVLLQGVHKMVATDLGKPWTKAEKPSSKIVFIGKKLPKDIFLKGLESCLV